MAQINIKNKIILITGVAGFIGANLAKRILNDYADVSVIGVDNISKFLIASTNLP